ncbi:MAG: hypothetical protein CMJ85_14085 [Planctomycetes bacterium]|nr:hypothetical protein [Planctomycetota bacterium]
MSFKRSPDANLHAQILAKKPTTPGGQRRRRGGLALAFCKTCNKIAPRFGGQQRASARRGGLVLELC